MSSVRGGSRNKPVPDAVTTATRAKQAVTTTTKTKQTGGAKTKQSAAGKTKAADSDKPTTGKANKKAKTVRVTVLKRQSRVLLKFVKEFL